MSHAHQELLQFLPLGGGDILEHSLAFLLSRGETIFSFFTFTQLYFEKCQICIFLFTVNIAAISDVPVCATSEPVIYGVSKNERVDIVCRVASNPAEVQFRWTFNNSAELIRWVVTSTLFKILFYSINDLSNR